MINSLLANTKVKLFAKFCKSIPTTSYGAWSINAKFSLLQPKPKTTHSANTVESTNADGIEVLNHYPWKDCAAASAKFMAYARQVAEDVVLVVEQRNLSPIQLTLF